MHNISKEKLIGKINSYYVQFNNPSLNTVIMANQKRCEMITKLFDNVCTMNYTTGYFICKSNGLRCNISIFLDSNVPFDFIHLYFRIAPEYTTMDADAWVGNTIPILLKDIYV